jgi:hypothetical protein
VLTAVVVALCVVRLVVIVTFRWRNRRIACLDFLAGRCPVFFSFAGGNSPGNSPVGWK